MSSLNYKIDNGVLKALINPDNFIGDIDELSKVIESHAEVKSVGLDLYKCVYIQSKPLANIISLKKIAMAKGITIELLNVNENIIQVLQLTNLQKLFVIRDDYSSFSVNELCEKFLDIEKAPNISDYLAANYNDDVQAKLVEIVSSEDPILVEYAILTMGRAQDHANIEIYRKALGADEASVKAAAILVLGWIGDTESKETLYSLLTSKELNVPEAAAASIALLSDSTDSEKIAKYLNDSDPRIRTIAIYALSLINDEKAYSCLSELLKAEKEEMVRVTLVKKLSSFNNPHVSEILLGLLDDSSIAIKEAAASGLSKKGGGEFAGQLVKKVKDGDNWVAFFAAKSLAGVTDQNIIKELEEDYNSVDQNVKLAIIEALGKCSSVKPEFFISKMKDSNEDIRKEALSSLYNLHSSEALKVATELYNTDDSWLVRYKAVDIILSLKPDGYDNMLRNRLKDEDNKYILEQIIGNIGE